MLKPQASLSIVNRAYEILSASPLKWTKYEFAKNADAKPVDATSEDACQFCMIGSLQRAHYELNGPEVDWLDNRYIGAKALVMGIIYIVTCDIAIFNDQSTYEGVLDVLKAATQPSLLLSGV